MIGLFSFRDMSIHEAIDFFMEFIRRLNIDNTLNKFHVTIHPDMMEYWEIYYKKYNVDVLPDENCIWTDGDIGGYCTEFYINDIEIGNIVNPLGNCIDVGFGLERLELVINNKTITLEDTLLNAASEIINAGILPSGKKHGYILRKIIKLINKNPNLLSFNDKHGLNYNNKNLILLKEKIREEKLTKEYNRLKNKKSHQDKDANWWYDTHGIDINEINKIN